ncbi:DNA cytosine methyltransferase [Hoeflea sp. G2-23]|uniref:Cytosine-specific methyltransferase n=1 Tax=Hoeflea algicola TaxID=2983763 RepID=A0ABT3ZAS9_9HYPH|nr:DNA cytosine methyltransferase [Hoeflea algicola]MCY0148829.1 DNA cytosine methyltransferase [Hoeflea algicola]
MISSQPRPVKVVDVFAGAGGLSLAAKQAGMDVVFAVELDRWAAETYRLNFCKEGDPDSPTLYEADIANLCPDELREKHFGDNGNCDILLGGPPCQGFSTHRIKNAGIKDPRNKLIHRYFEFVRALRPKVFVMENVPGILWERHCEYLEQFYEEGRREGYHMYDPVVLDARDFGLPQRRKRVFVLGVEQNVDRGSFAWPPPPTHGSEKLRQENPDLLPWVPCQRVFGPVKAGDPNNVHMQHSEALTEVFARTPHNGGSRRDSGRTLPCHEKHNGHKDVYGRIDPSQPAPTMTTACINPSKGRFVHPRENHGITARQAARIQTFPDNFQFAGGLMAAGKQIGNAVPVKLGEVILRQMSALLSSETGLPLELNQVDGEVRFA